MKTIEEKRAYWRSNYYKYKSRCKRNNKEWIEKNREKRAEYYRKYRQTEKGRQNTLNAVKKYELNHPERKSAWNKANKIKRKPCMKCGKLNTHRHHPDINNPLKVNMLCPLHHKQQSHKM